MRRPTRSQGHRAAEPTLRVTTIAFPEPLFLALRTRALEQRTTLRALVLAACEEYLAPARSRRR